MTRVRHFLDREGVCFRVLPLTQDEAAQHASLLVAIHNAIPFQHWTEQNLLANGDDRRVFHGKWELSTLATTVDGTPMGFCIAFELQPDHQYYEHAGIYMHRMSLASPYRGRQIGALLHAETLWRAFCRGMQIMAPPGTPVRVYGQTNELAENIRVLEFHRDAGFLRVGRKPYSDRVDVIMEMTVQSFLRSRHTELWLARAVEREDLPDGGMLPEQRGELDPQCGAGEVPA